MATDSDFKAQAIEEANMLLAEYGSVFDSNQFPMLRAQLAHMYGRGWLAGAEEIYDLGQSILEETRVALLDAIDVDK
jgi:hypothetical protein